MIIIFHMDLDLQWDMIIAFPKLKPIELKEMQRISSVGDICGITNYMELSTTREDTRC
jgi:hypothetical protein